MNQDLKRAKKVLEEVLESKVDNLVKLHFDLYYRLENTVEWGEKAKKLQEEVERIQHELNILKIAGGKSTKDKERAIRLENKQREVGNKLKSIRKSIDEIPIIANTIEILLKDDNRFLKTLQSAVDNPKKVYKETNKYLKKLKGRKK